jgi:ABC-type lipopolysaccharide export system ATPase subunit
MKSIIAQGLSKSYKKRKVVSNVSLEVNKGEIVTLVYVGKYSILERLKYGAIYFTGEIKVKGI